MSRVCELTGAKANNGMAVSHSHIRTKKLQQVGKSLVEMTGLQALETKTSSLLHT